MDSFNDKIAAKTGSYSLPIKCLTFSLLLFLLVNSTCIQTVDHQKEEPPIQNSPQSLPANSYTTMAEDHVYTVVEQMPMFPGCNEEDYQIRKKCAEKDMLRYLYKHLKYPPLAREQGIESNVVVRFIVEKDGSLTNFKTLKGAPILANEYIRVLKSMPDWLPGKQKGTPVRVQFNIPIKIHLEE